MKKYFVLIIVATLFVSCLKDGERPVGTYLSGNGILVVNEGNFMGGNGSVSFFSYDSLKIYNDLFSTINGRPLGDVPNSAEFHGDNLYIVVNNSGRIEIVRRADLVSVATISGLNSPRNIAFSNSERAYVTSMYSDSLTVIDLTTNAISGYINLRRTSESIVIAGDMAYIASWVGGHEVMVVNTSTDEVVDSIQVGVEPESMAIDNNNMIWVLCNGGYMREHYAELDVINPSGNRIQKQFIFPDIQESPSCLRMDGYGENLYYLKNGVFKMNISAAALPASPLIPEVDRFFYKLGIDPVTDAIFVTDAIDYQQKGYLLFYDSSGSLFSTYQTDIIPGYLCFKVSGK